MLHLERDAQCAGSKQSEINHRLHPLRGDDTSWNLQERDKGFTDVLSPFQDRRAEGDSEVKKSLV